MGKYEELFGKRLVACHPEYPHTLCDLPADATITLSLDGIRVTVPIPGEDVVMEYAAHPTHGWHYEYKHAPPPAEPADWGGDVLLARSSSARS